MTNETHELKTNNHDWRSRIEDWKIQLKSINLDTNIFKASINANILKFKSEYFSFDGLMYKHKYEYHFDDRPMDMFLESEKQYEEMEVVHKEFNIILHKYKVPLLVNILKIFEILEQFKKQPELISIYKEYQTYNHNLEEDAHGYYNYKNETQYNSHIADSYFINKLISQVESVLDADYSETTIHILQNLYAQKHIIEIIFENVIIDIQPLYFHTRNIKLYDLYNGLHDTTKYYINTWKFPDNSYEYLFNEILTMSQGLYHTTSIMKSDFYENMYKAFYSNIFNKITYKYKHTNAFSAYFSSIFPNNNKPKTKEYHPETYLLRPSEVYKQMKTTNKNIKDIIQDNLELEQIRIPQMNLNIKHSDQMRTGERVIGVTFSIITVFALVYYIYNKINNI